MLSVENKPIMLSVIMLSVVMLNVMAHTILVPLPIFVKNPRS